MAITRINNNIDAMNASRQLNRNTNQLSLSLEHLSSGLRINRASDDASGLSISEKLRTQIRGLSQAGKNAQDAVSLVNTAEGALDETTSILQRIRELAVKAANTGGLDVNAIQAAQDEINASIQEITRIGANTQFSTRRLLNGTNDITASAQNGYGVTVAKGPATTTLANGTHYLTLTQTVTGSSVITSGTGGMNVGAGFTVAGSTFDTGTYAVSVTNATTDVTNTFQTEAWNLQTDGGVPVGTSLATALTNFNGSAITTADDIVIAGNTSMAAFNAVYAVSGASTLEDIRAWVETTINNADGSSVDDVAVTITSDGQLQVQELNVLTGSAISFSFGVDVGARASTGNVFGTSAFTLSTNNAPADGATLVTALDNFAGAAITTNDDIVISGVTSAGGSFSAAYDVTNTTTLEDVRNWMEVTINAADAATGDNVTVAIAADGSFNITENNAIVGSTFAFDMGVDVGARTDIPNEFQTAAWTLATNAAPAGAATLVTAIDTFTGSAITTNDDIVISGTTANGTSFSAAYNVTGTTTLDDIRSWIETTINSAAGSTADNVAVTIATTGEFVVTENNAISGSQFAMDLGVDVGARTDVYNVYNSAAWTVNVGGAPATGAMLMTTLDTFSGSAIASGADFLFTGVTALGSGVTLQYGITAATTLEDVRAALETAINSATASTGDDVTITINASGAFVITENNVNSGSALTYTMGLDLGGGTTADTGTTSTETQTATAYNAAAGTMARATSAGTTSSETNTVPVYVSAPGTMAGASSDGTTSAASLDTAAVDGSTNVGSLAGATADQALATISQSTEASFGGAVVSVGGGPAQFVRHSGTATFYGQAPSNELDPTPQITLSFGTLTNGNDSLAVVQQQWTGSLDGGNEITFQNGDQEVVFKNGSSAGYTSGEYILLNFAQDVTAGTVMIDVENNGLNFHIGANENQGINVAIGDLRASNLGNLDVSGQTVADINVKTYTGANLAIDIVDSAIEQVSRQRSYLGSITNRLEKTINNLAVSEENLSASESRIRDADLAFETTKFTKNQILMQASTAILAQANSAPQNLLQLLR